MTLSSSIEFAVEEQTTKASSVLTYHHEIKEGMKIRIGLGAVLLFGIWCLYVAQSSHELGV